MGDYMHKLLLRDDITLRRLELTDAADMLEWMLEPDIYGKMQYDPAEQSLEKCRRFIEQSWTDDKNFHYAITNQKKEYLGTISLKNIDKKNQNAEFAIALHPKAMGKQVGTSALRAIMEIAFMEMELNKVYLYVRSDNERAVAFYKKNGLEYEGCFREHIYSDGKFRDIYWFALRKRVFEQWKNNIYQ